MLLLKGGICDLATKNRWNKNARQNYSLKTTTPSATNNINKTINPTFKCDVIVLNQRGGVVPHRLSIS